MSQVIRDGRNAWLEACHGTASDVLAECGISAPPVDAWTVARMLGIRVAFDSHQPGRARIKRIGGKTAILVRPDERPEREQWALAHEIGESLAHRVFERLAVEPSDFPPQRREQVANAMASSLLLPESWFLRDAGMLDGDVLQLKRIYSTASHELILMNLLRLPSLTLVTVFDLGRTTRRRGNGQLAPPPLLPLERRVWHEVHSGGQPAEASGDGIRVQGWPVHEPGWKRELLRTTALEGIDEDAARDDDEPGPTQYAEYADACSAC